jgi:hypothetical protein
MASGYPRHLVRDPDRCDQISAFAPVRRCFTRETRPIQRKGAELVDTEHPHVWVK